MGPLLLSPGSWCAQGSVCALQESVSQSCVSSGSSMVGLMVTSSKRAYATPRDPTSSGDTQTQFCLSLCGVSGSWCAQGMFEPSEHLWWVWGLILNVISCWWSARRRLTKQSEPCRFPAPSLSPPPWAFLTSERASECFTKSGPRCWKDFCRQGNQSIWWPDAV